jgi:hypothetical protein
MISSTDRPADGYVYVLMKLAGLVLLGLCAVAHAEVPATSGNSLVLLVDSVDRYDAKLTVTVNDMPIGKTDLLEYPKGAGTEFIRIPLLLLHTGHNTLHVAFAEVNPKDAHGLDMRFVELAKLEPQTVHKELQHITASATKDKPFATDIVFDVTSKLPKRSFETSKVITNDAATALQLKAAANALAKQWDKKRLGTAFTEQGSDDNLTNIARWLAHPKLRVDLRADDERTTMQVFAGGHLARLVWDNILPWSIRGGANDAPSGQMGPVNIEIDVWFRSNDKGAFVPVAAWVTGVAPGKL